MCPSSTQVSITGQLSSKKVPDWWGAQSDREERYVEKPQNKVMMFQHMYCKVLWVGR